MGERLWQKVRESTVAFTTNPLAQWHPAVQMVLGGEGDLKRSAASSWPTLPASAAELRRRC